MIKSCKNRKQAKIIINNLTLQKIAPLVIIQSVGMLIVAQHPKAKELAPLIKEICYHKKISLVRFGDFKANIEGMIEQVIGEGLEDCWEARK